MGTRRQDEMTYGMVARDSNTVIGANGFEQTYSG